MKIDFLKINSFGNLLDKEIELKDKINIIYGKNESGKSTIVKFITNMLYGSSKNKNGREISDFDRYKPWAREEFSGKMKYTLTDGESYEIYREFKKKQPKIYNSKLEDISEHYTIDKNTGSQFFYDQTGINEDVFLTTAISMQEETKLDVNSQNMLLQKISNLVTSGKENLSYKKIYEKLNKKQVEEVGNDRTVGRPLNKVNQEIFEARKELEELEQFKIQEEKLKQEKEQIEKELKEKETIYDLIKKVQVYKEEERLNKKEIEIIEISMNDAEEKLKLLQKNKNQEVTKPKEKTAPKFLIIISILAILLGIVMFLLNTMKVFSYILVFIGICFGIANYILDRKYKKKNQEREMEIKKTTMFYQKEIEILEETISKYVYQINTMSEKMEKNKKKYLNNLESEFKYDIDSFTYHEIVEDDKIDITKTIFKIEEELTNSKVRINTIQLQEKQIEEKMERYVAIEENLQINLDEKKKIEELEECIVIAKKCLDKAYEKIKDEISPHFSNHLSKTISAISGGKYKKVLINDKDGISVELADGSYVPANLLSIGTIDELYLSLRINALNEISKENLPIVLDESFAYFDNERLENILKYLNENYDNQIIIMTCSNREKQILENLNLEYNYIEL